MATIQVTWFHFCQRNFYDLKLIERVNWRSTYDIQARQYLFQMFPSNDCRRILEDLWRLVNGWPVFKSNDCTFVRRTLSIWNQSSDSRGKQLIINYVKIHFKFFSSNDWKKILEDLWGWANGWLRLKSHSFTFVRGNSWIWNWSEESKEEQSSFNHPAPIDISFFFQRTGKGSSRIPAPATQHEQNCEAAPGAPRALCAHTIRSHIRYISTVDIVCTHASRLGVGLRTRGLLPRGRTRSTKSQHQFPELDAFCWLAVSSVARVSVSWNEDPSVLCTFWFERVVCSTIRRTQMSWHGLVWKSLNSVHWTLLPHQQRAEEVLLQSAGWQLETADRTWQQERCQMEKTNASSSWDNITRKTATTLIAVLEQTKPLPHRFRPRFCAI